MTTKRLKSGDLLLLLLYVKGSTGKLCEAIAGRTRLLKMIVAFEVELYSDFKKDNEILAKEDLPEFFAWHFGPMSTKVLEDLEFFRKINLIESKDINSITEEEVEEMASIFDDSDSEFNEQEYSLTEVGKKYVEQKVISHLSENQILLLEKLKKQFNSVSLYKILTYIYNNKKYEKYIKKDKSKIYDSFVKKA